MKGVLPSLLFGTLTGVALFGLLWAIEPNVVLEVESWRTEWEDSELAVQRRSVTRGEDSSPLLRRVRRIFEEPAYKGTRVWRYDVNMIRTEVVRLPSEGLLEQIPEGRHRKFQLEDDRRRANVFRSGRYIALVALDVRILGRKFASNPDMVDRILDVFENAAEQLQRP